jgi:hypothetical protein
MAVKLKAVTYPQVPFLLLKTPPLHNILVGEDPSQVKFAERILKLPCVKKDKLSDSDFLGVIEPQLFQLETTNQLELSEDILQKVGIWSLAPLTPGSSGVNTLVKLGAELVGVKLERGNAQAYSNSLFIDDNIDFLPTAILEAAFQVQSPLTPTKYWDEPWTHPFSWLPPDPTKLPFRLHSLYRKLVAYVFVKHRDKNALKKFGINEKRSQKLSDLSLDLDKVSLTLEELSIWRNQRYDPFICSIKISKIWAKL